jgi:hypothetical protein
MYVSKHRTITNSVLQLCDTTVHRHDRLLDDDDDDEDDDDDKHPISLTD